MSQQTIASHEPFLVVDSPYETERWRPLVNWVLYIPHAVILYALRALSPTSSPPPTPPPARTGRSFWK